MVVTRSIQPTGEFGLSPPVTTSPKGKGSYTPVPRHGYSPAGDYFEVDFDPKRNYLGELKRACDNRMARGPDNPFGPDLSSES